MDKKKNLSLIAAIVFAATAISLSIVFLGLQLSKNSNRNLANSNDIEFLASYKYVEELKSKIGFGSAAPVSYSKIAFNKNDEHIKGEQSAKISIIEYSDFECPYCKVFHPELPKLLDKYPEQINWVFRHYPLSFHDPLATQQAIASECVAEQTNNDQFWNFTDQVFEKTTSNGNGMTEDELRSLALKIDGVDADKFDKCYSSDDMAQAVQEEVKLAAELGVTGTPHIIIADHQNKTAILIEGGLSSEGFEVILKTLGLVK